MSCQLNGRPDEVRHGLAALATSVSGPRSSTALPLFWRKTNHVRQPAPATSSQASPSSAASTPRRQSLRRVDRPANDDALVRARRASSASTRRDRPARRRPLPHRHAHADGEQHDVSGVYREIVPNEKLVFTWAWKSTPERESLVTVMFKPDGAGTMLTLIARAVLRRRRTRPPPARLDRRASTSSKSCSPEQEDDMAVTRTISTGTSC